MTNKTYEEQVLQLARQMGTLRAQDLTPFNIPRIILTRLIKSGQLERVARGLYRLPGFATSEKETMVAIALKVPKAVFCLLTALQYYELTTQIPRQVWIGMPQGSHTPRIKYPPIKMVQYSGRAYSEGIEIVTIDQVDVRLYNPAKTVVDCFKHRNKIGLDVALEALKEVINQKKSTRDELFHYATILRVKKIMQPYLEAM